MTHPIACRRALLRAPFCLAFAVLAVMTTGAGFLEDEIQCDHAAAHLEGCCEALSPTPLECANVDGCSGRHDDPWLTEAESRCIRPLNCRRIRESGVCERVASRVETMRDARAAEDPDAEDVVASELEAVCP